MILCQAIIWLTDKSNTYCMREMGHKGKCSPEPDKKPTTLGELTPEQQKEVLSRTHIGYGTKG
jgi:hypothetical protein